MSRKYRQDSNRVMSSSPVHEDVATALIGFLDPVALMAVSMFTPDDWLAVQLAIREVADKISTRVEEAPLQSLSWDFPGISEAPPEESIFGGPLRDNERKFLRFINNDRSVFEDRSGDIDVPAYSSGYVEGEASFTTAASKSGDVGVPAWVFLCADSDSDVDEWVKSHKDDDDISGSPDWEDYDGAISWGFKRVDDDSYTSEDYLEIQDYDFELLQMEAADLYNISAEEWDPAEDEDEV